MHFRAKLSECRTFTLPDGPSARQSFDHVDADADQLREARALKRRSNSNGVTGVDLWMAKPPGFARSERGSASLAMTAETGLGERKKFRLIAANARDTLRYDTFDSMIGELGRSTILRISLHVARSP